MAEIEVMTKKWGDSLAVIIPKNIVNAEHIKLHQKLILSIKRTVDLSDLFGAFKTTKTAQQIKNENKEGWN